MLKIGLISCGDRVPKGTFRLHSRFDSVVNFTASDDTLVSVVRENVGDGPNNIVLSDFDSESVAEELVIDSRSIVLGKYIFDLEAGRVFESAFDLVPADRSQKLFKFLGQILVSHGPPKSLAYLISPFRKAEFLDGFEGQVATRIESCFMNLIFADSEAEVRASLKGMKGLGFGLTPAGDDFNAGFLTGLWYAPGLFSASDSWLSKALGEALFSDLKSENIFSNTALKYASEGRVYLKVKKLLEAISCSSEAAIDTSARGVMASGQTSGTDFLVGFWTAASIISEKTQELEN